MAMLIINRDETWCGVCGVPADPTQTEHEVESYGCGATFDRVSSDDASLRDEVEKLRPDLKWQAR